MSQTSSRVGWNGRVRLVVSETMPGISAFDLTMHKFLKVILEDFFSLLLMMLLMPNAPVQPPARKEPEK